jgi:hypothetical protein
MKKYLMLPVMLVMTVSIAACSNTGTDNPQADFAAPPPPPPSVDPMAAPAGDPMAPAPVM